jgi:uncharacterized membrane protein YvbJ
MKIVFLIIVAIIGFGISANAQSSESVARKFCTAVYSKDMVKAKSFMTSEGARRTPDKMSLTDEECRILLNKLNKAAVKIIKNEYSSSIVTVRFYDPNYAYLDKKGRWFCCSIGLFNDNGTWKVTEYGY